MIWTRRVLAVLWLVGTAAAAQDVPQQISFSGRVSDNGALLSGSHDLAFRLFTAPTGGAQVWTETHTGLIVTDGLVDVQLGGTTALDASIFTGPSMYLELAIDGTTLAPRTPVVSAPYAIKAGTSATLGTLKPADVQVRVTGTCGANQAVSAVAANGTVSCQNVSGGGSVTSVATGTGLTGGPITSSGTIGLSPTVQNWSTQPSCGAGTHLTAVTALGVPTCVADATGTVTQIKTGAGLIGGPITNTGTLDIAATVPNWSTLPACTVGSTVASVALNGTATCVPSRITASGHSGLGYVWVSPTGVADPTYSWESSGQGVVVTRASAGKYTVTFTGLTNATGSGHPVVSAWNLSPTTTPVVCVTGTGSSYTAATITVYCYALPSGALTDSYFNVLWLQ